MHFLCDCLPTRNSLFIHIAVFFIVQNCFNTKLCETVGFPEGYSRVLFNLFPRKNSDSNLPSVSYGYTLNHPTGRNFKDAGAGDTLAASESIVKPTVILPNGSNSPSSEQLQQVLPAVIFESTKDVDRLVPGVPLLFKLRQPSPTETFDASHWSLPSHPRILIAGSVIPSNFRYIYKEYSKPVYEEVQIPEKTLVEQNSSTELQNSTSSPSEHYLPVTANVRISSTTGRTTTTIIPEKINLLKKIDGDFPQPFPLPRPSLKQGEHFEQLIDERFKDTNEEFLGIKRINELLPPPQISQIAEENRVGDHKTSNLEFDYAYEMATSTAPYEIALSENSATTEMSSYVELLETDKHQMVTSPSVNKLLRQRQIQESHDQDQTLDLPPVHFEPDVENDPTTTSAIYTSNGSNSKDLKVKSAGHDKVFPQTDDYNDPDLQIPINPKSAAFSDIRPVQTFPPSVADNLGDAQVHIPPSPILPTGYSTSTPSNSVLVTPILPQDPEQDKIVMTSPKSSIGPVISQITPNIYNDQPQVVYNEDINDERGLSDKTSDSTLSSNPAGGDALQQLIAILQATLQQSRSFPASQPGGQSFNFHIGTININFNHKDDSVPHQYTILSNVGINPPQPQPTEFSVAGPFRETQIFTTPATTTTKVKTQFSTFNASTSTKIPFTVSLPKLIPPLEQDEEIRVSESRIQSTTPISDFPAAEETVQTEMQQESVELEQENQDNVTPPALSNSPAELVDVQSSPPQKPILVSEIRLPHLIVPTEERLITDNITGTTTLDSLQDLEIDFRKYRRRG